MSSLLVGLALERYRGPKHLKLTLLVLADAADPGSHLCSTTYDDIAGIAECSRSTAIRNVKQLVDDGLVTIVREGGRVYSDQHRKYLNVPNAYRVNPEALMVLPHWRMLAPEAVENTADSVDEAVDNLWETGVAPMLPLSPVRPPGGSTGATLVVQDIEDLSPVVVSQVQEDDVPVGSSPAEAVSR